MGDGEEEIRRHNNEKGPSASAALFPGGQILRTLDTAQASFAYPPPPQTDYDQPQCVSESPHPPIRPLPILRPTPLKKASPMSLLPSMIT